MNISVKRLYCTGCGACVTACPLQIIKLEKRFPTIEQDECVDCSACREVCPGVAEKSRGFHFVHLEYCQNCIGICRYNRVHCLKQERNCA